MNPTGNKKERNLTHGNTFLQPSVWRCLPSSIYVWDGVESVENIQVPTFVLVTNSDTNK